MKTTIGAILVLAGAIWMTEVSRAQAPARGGGGRGPRAEWAPGYLEPGEPVPPYVSAETPQGTGPYPAIMATEPGAETFVAYYPANLSSLGSSMPVVVWGNGSCTYLGNKFRHFLTEISSHGYFVLGGGPMGAPDGGRSETITIASNNPLRNPEEPAPAPAAPSGQPRVTPELLSKGIDWAIKENNRQGSKFYHKLDTSNIAVMGQSCGGGVAATFGSDKRVKTVGLWSSATNRSNDLSSMMTKPVLIVTGDPRYDIAFYWGLSAFESLKKPLVFYAWRVNMTHLGTYRQANGGEVSPVAIAWLDWQLKGDKTAARMFQGAQCGLCTNAHWHVQKKNLE